MKVEKLEQNVVNSFELAKRDIRMLRAEVQRLTYNYEEVLKVLTDIRERQFSCQKELVDLGVLVTKKPKTVKKTVTYVASETGKSFHQPNCPFAQNINPKLKIKFKTKSSALAKKYKACRCVK